MLLFIFVAVKVFSRSSFWNFEPHKKHEDLEI